MKNFQENRIFGILLITLIYVGAAAVGIGSYMLLPFVFWLNLFLSDVFATVVVFIFSVLLKNASVYDPYWSVQPIVIILVFLISKGWTLLGGLLFGAVLFWGIRLTVNWAYTFYGFGYQDWRYTMLKEKTGKFYPIINFIGIHMVPTLVVYGCILPAVFVVYYKAVLRPLSLLFMAISVGAAVLQLIADIQMHTFRAKKKAGKASGFIREGLWKYSRHPNYLGEILMWWGVGLTSVCVMPQAWYLLAGALANTLLFFCVSIPMADGRMAQRAGFEEYKSQTRMLLPIKKRIKE